MDTDFLTDLLHSAKELPGIYAFTIIAMAVLATFLVVYYIRKRVVPDKEFNPKDIADLQPGETADVQGKLKTAGKRSYRDPLVGLKVIFYQLEAGIRRRKLFRLSRSRYQYSELVHAAEGNDRFFRLEDETGTILVNHHSFNVGVSHRSLFRSYKKEVIPDKLCVEFPDLLERGKSIYTNVNCRYYFRMKYILENEEIHIRGKVIRANVDGEDVLVLSGEHPGVNVIPHQEYPEDDGVSYFADYTEDEENSFLLPVHTGIIMVFAVLLDFYALLIIFAKLVPWY